MIIMLTFLKGTIVIPEAEAIQAVPVIEHTTAVSKFLETVLE